MAGQFPFSSQFQVIFQAIYVRVGVIILLITSKVLTPVYPTRSPCTSSPSTATENGPETSLIDFRSSTTSSISSPASFPGSPIATFSSLHLSDLDTSMFNPALSFPFDSPHSSLCNGGDISSRTSDPINPKFRSSTSPNSSPKFKSNFHL
jgi:hypothetical protein